MKKFLISIDTEGDNLWEWKPGKKITTENAKYLQRFQNLCDEYGFKPTYLTNYEMAVDSEFQKFSKSVINKSTAEIGLHIHAWNNPPEFKLNGTGDKLGAPYITEYPNEIIQKKVDYTSKILADLVGNPIVTHRAGRWATNDAYFNILADAGIKYDCSVTPHIDWSANCGFLKNSVGNDYTSESEKPHLLGQIQKSIWEIPVTVRTVRKIFLPDKMTCRSLAGAAYRAVLPQNIWLRPTNKNLTEMKWLIDKVMEESDTDYIMFMLHSSEFMPGGSPTFRDIESINELYRQMRELFSYAERNYCGMTIGEYGELIRNGGAE